MNDDIDGLVPMRSFKVLDRDMPRLSGMRLLAERLGLSAAKAREMTRDRSPEEGVAEERRSLDRLPKCFVTFDILMTDVLHTGYGELKHIGIGRRYLVNKVLRAVLAGKCDAEDVTGSAGDFLPRSWMIPSRAKSMHDIQVRCLEEFMVGEAKLLKSVRVRLGKASTHVLLELERNCSAIRSLSRGAYASGRSGLRAFSDMLVAYRKRLFRETRLFDFKNRKRRRRVKAWTSGKSKDFQSATKRKAHMGFSVFLRSVYDLRKLLDPNVPNWFRRPTDDDWAEGMRGRGSRRPPFFKRSNMLRRYGIGPVPGISGPVDEDTWRSLKTDWSLDEARGLLKEVGSKSN